MAVHKEDKRAVKALIAQNKRLAANKARLVKQVLALRAKEQKYALQANGIMTSVESIESQIEGNLAAIRGYSFGG